MKKLPIGIDTFSKLIEGNYLYVDKTKIAFDLINQGSYYFLSRPRRFGKSLFLSTLKEIFKGNQALFKDQYIYDKWDFSKSYPVIHINFATGFKGELSKFNRSVRFALKEVERTLGLSIENEDATECFQELIWQAYEKYQQPVVVLIDEYDKSILDNITDKDKARSIRDQLKQFYSVIKTNGSYLQFVFITGVSKFSKVNLFSGLNNLNDITLNPQFGNICGYTHDNLQNDFGSYFEGVDLEEVKKWYDGYNYLGNKVYNPYDVLLFLANQKEFGNYWWETGNPSFLMDLVRANDYSIPQVENYKATRELLGSFDTDSIALEVLLWQTGYLTITQKIKEHNRIKYQLGIPNLEVQYSLNDFFIDALTTQRFQKITFQDQLRTWLEVADLKQLKQTFFNLFASIPYHNFTNNKMANYEGYYASVLYAYLASLGYPIIPEDVTNKGRIDLTLQLPDTIYLFEFKVVNQATNQALHQIKTKKYYQKYQNDKPIYLIGIEFGKAERNIVNWEVEQI